MSKRSKLGSRARIATTNMIYGGPIYPVPVKPPSRFNRWSDWPEDLVPAIKALVRGWYRVGIFKCAECDAFCHSHPRGAAHIRGSGHGIPTGRDRGIPVCDDCLLILASELQSTDQATKLVLP